MRVTCVTNNKGGVGKTTTAHVLAAGLARRKKKVLAVDLDPQINLSFSVEYEERENAPDLYDLFTDTDTDVKDAIVKTSGGFDLLPGSQQLAGADIDLYDLKKKEYLLRELLSPVVRKYDYIIIDTPPALGALTINALTAADDVVIPIEADVYSLQGLISLSHIITTVQKYTNTDLHTAGLLITRYSSRARVTKAVEEALEEAKKLLDTKIYKAHIRETVAIKESHFTQQDIFTAFPKHKVTQDYTEFIREYMKER